MQISGKAAMALVVGSLVVGSIVSVTAQEPTPTPGAPQPAARPDGAEMRPHHGPKGPGGMKGAIRSESVFRDRQTNAITTVRHDQGVLEDVSGSTLVIKEDDGTTVRVPVADSTVIRRDGAEAKLADLKDTDHVGTLRVKTGDGEFSTKSVHAVSAERYAEMERQRQACEQDAASCRRGPGRGFRGFGRFGPPREPGTGAPGPGGPGAGVPGGPSAPAEQTAA